MTSTRNEAPPSSYEAGGALADAPQGASDLSEPALVHAFKLHALLFREGKFWIAQVLEHDLATAATRREALLSELVRFLTVQVVGTVEAGFAPFASLPTAPAHLRHVFEQIPLREPLTIETPVAIMLMVEAAWLDDRSAGDERLR